jgi:hydroxymethylpyrimidine pyrophosphatase-like HAD family hydrolase
VKAPRQVLYTDVDGTLVGPLGNMLWDGSRQPTAVAAEALVRAAREGLEIVAVTGRAQGAMWEVARLLGLATWFCELGGVRVYERGEHVVHDHGAYPGEGLPGAALAEARALLTASFPGRIEEHTPWNTAREASVLLRGEVDPGEARAVLDEAGFGWTELVDNGVIPRRFETLAGLDRVRVYHLVPQGVSKLAAIAADRAMRGLARENCAMIGDAAADLDCRVEVGRCFLVANALVKDPSLAWAAENGSGVEVLGSGHGAGFAEAVAALLD